MKAGRPRLPALALVLIVTTGSGDARAHEAHTHANAPTQSDYVRSEHQYALPDVALVDSTGARIVLPQLLGADKPVVMGFVFTSCSAICPVLSATFAQVQRRLGERREAVRLVSISIDPEFDTPQRLHDYARKFDAQADWRWVTGAPRDITAVQRAFDAYRGGKNNHLPLLFVRPNAASAWIRIEGFASAEVLLREIGSGAP